MRTKPNRSVSVHSNPTKYLKMNKYLPPRSRSNHTSRLVLTAVALAVSMSMSLRAQAANTDYSNQTLDHGIDVIGAGNSISGDNLTITGSSLVSSSNRNEGIYIGAGSTGHFGGDKLEVKFTASDTTLKVG